MIPDWLPMLVMVLGVCRLVRVAGWDEHPWVERLREWVVGTEIQNTGSANAHMGLAPMEGGSVVVYRRPTVAKFLGCPWCVGFWLSLAVYLAWRGWPTATVTVMAPLSFSELVGLVSKNLDR